MVFTFHMDEFTSNGKSNYALPNLYKFVYDVGGQNEISQHLLWSYVRRFIIDSSKFNPTRVN